ncbi:hypothetical protein [Streptococcus gallolyticus]|uniref:hypothetical protein n=1 Tax=Streptococcus gallolyticus TaxID=315405 RepID=UPI00228531B3|nr:hypothetical protein [Streptococcus gallolyticus]MCY7156681.1 hypothetical protein [Streptococcus gallolyticus subsp. gallolyticus]
MVTFNEAMLSNDRTLAIRVGDFTSENIKSANFKYGYITGDDFTPGGTYAGTASILFTSIVESFKKLDVVYPEIGLLVGSKVEWVKMGKYYIDDIKIDRNANTTEIELMDEMFKLNESFKTDLKYPAQIRDVILEIATKTGVTLASDDFGTTAIQQHVDEPISDKLTYRDVLSQASQLLGFSCFFNRNGELEVRGLTESGITITADNYFLHGLEKSEVEYQIAGITCETKDDEVLTVGLQTGRSLEIENPLATQDTLNALYYALKDIVYYPYDLSYQGHLKLDVGQWVTIKTNKDEVFKVPVLYQSFSFSGGLTSTISADSVAGSDAQYTYGSFVTKKIDQKSTRIQAEVQQQLKYADEEFKKVSNEMLQQSLEYQNSVRNELATSKAELETQIDTAKTQAELNAKTYADEINQATAEVAEQANTAANSLKSDLAKVKTDLTTVSNTANSAKTSASEAKQQLTAVANDLSTAKQDLQAQASQLTAQASAQSELTKRVSTVEETANGTKSTVSELTKTVAQNGKDITSVTARTKTVEDDLLNTKTTLSQVKTTADSTSQKTATLETGLNGLNAKFETLKIGSRNYFKNSKSRKYYINSTETQDVRTYIGDEFWQNDTRFTKNYVRMSFDIAFNPALPSNFTTNVHFSASPWYNCGGITFKGGTTALQHFDLKFDLSGASKSYKTDNVFIRLNNTLPLNTAVSLENFNLYLSAVVEDYNQNEADIESKVAEYKQTADQNYASLQSTVQTLDGTVKQNKSEFDQTASQLKTSISAVEGKASELDGDITKLNTTLTQTANGLEQLSTQVTSQGNTITSHTNSINSLSTGLSAKVSQTDFNTLSGRVTTAENNITAKANELSSKISSVEGLIPTSIDTVNLIKGTGSAFVMGYGITNTTWNETKKQSILDFSIPGVNRAIQSEILPQNGKFFDFKPIKGMTYTQSIMIDTDATFNPNGQVQCSWFTNSGHNQQKAYIKKVGEHTYQVWSTYTWNLENTALRAFDWFGLYNVLLFRTTGTYLAFYKPKLTTGNLPSDWSPSPEDYDSALTQAKSEIKQTTDAISASVSALDSETVKSASLTINTDGIVMKAGKSTTDVANAIGSYFAVNQNAINLFSDKINVKANMIVDGAITSAKIASKSINTAHLNGKIITADVISSNAVTADAIKAGAITTDKMTANSINGDRITAGTLDAAKIKAGSITASQIASGTITSSQIKAGGISAANIATGAITTNHLATGSITADKIATNAIDVSKITGNVATFVTNAINNSTTNILDITSSYLTISSKSSTSTWSPSIRIQPSSIQFFGSSSGTGASINGVGNTTLIKTLAVGSTSGSYTDDSLSVDKSQSSRLTSYGKLGCFDYAGGGLRLSNWQNLGDSYNNDVSIGINEYISTSEKYAYMVATTRDISNPSRTYSIRFNSDKTIDLYVRNIYYYGVLEKKK